MLAREELRQGNEIAQGLAHLLAVDGYHIVMHPVMHPGGAAGSDVLSDLALVVREHQVHSAAVYVELAAQVLLSHHGALQMPSREAFAPRGRPFHNVLRLSLFPYREVERSPLVALAVEFTGAFERIVEVAAGQYAVTVVRIVLAHVEIYASVGLVGVAGVENGLDGFYLLDYMP